MPWGRLDDSLYDHPKVEALPSKIRNSCIGLWVRALSWSNRFLTDGVVSGARLQRLDGTPKEVAWLLETGLLDKLPDGNYAIHDFLSFNDPASIVRERRDRMRDMGRRGGERSGEVRRLNRDASTDTLELPSRPVHTRPVLEAPRFKGTAKRDPEVQRMLDLQEKARAERGDH